MSLVLTLVGNPALALDAADVARAARSLSAAGARPGEPDWLAPGLACDLAFDDLAWNVTKDASRVRRSAVDEEIWPSPALMVKNPPDTSNAIPFSDFTKSGALGFPEVTGPIFDEINEMYGTNIEPIFKK